MWEPLEAAEALDLAGSGVSWQPGFMGAQRELPSTLGVGLGLEWAGSGIPCEVGCLLPSPPIGGCLYTGMPGPGGR